jgi:hypothetical protein
MDDRRPRGPGRFVLKTLAVVSALGFLTLVMVQASAFYAPSPKPAKPAPHLLGPATKSAPVVRPAPLVKPEERKEREDRAYLGGTKPDTVIPPPLQLQPKKPQDRAYLGATKSLTVIPPPPLVQPTEPENRVYLPATKAGILGPLKISQPPREPESQGTTGPRD